MLTVKMTFFSSLEIRLFFHREVFQKAAQRLGHPDLCWANAIVTLLSQNPSVGQGLSVHQKYIKSSLPGA